MPDTLAPDVSPDAAPPLTIEAANEIPQSEAFRALPPETQQEALDTAIATVHQQALNEPGYDAGSFNRWADDMHQRAAPTWTQEAGDVIGGAVKGIGHLARGAGATVAGGLIAPIETGKMVIYPIVDNVDGQGNQLINWMAEIRQPGEKMNDWNKPGDPRDCVQIFQDWTFDWLNVPELSPHIREVNWTLRNRSGLPDGWLELAILVVTREMDGQTEWTAHEPAALKAGVDRRVVDAVKYRRDLAGIAEPEAAIIQLGREIFQSHHVSSETYARGLKAFGERGMVSLVLLMANYTMTTVITHAFDQQLRPDLDPLLPVAPRH